MKKYVSWEDVEKFIDSVANKYKNFNLTGVYGLPRGGLTLAVMVSHRLDIPLLSAPVKDCLIIDDICDSGESLLHYVKNSSCMNKPLYTIATMYYKDNDLNVIPDFYLYNKENDWIVFPWESKED